MKNNIKNIALFVFTTFLLASCASTNKMSNKISPEMSEQAKNQKVPEGKSLVYVYRVSSLGLAVGLQVSLNNKMLASFYPKRFYVCTLDQGKYVFTGHGENEDDIIITTEPGKKYYIEAKPKMGFASARIELELHDQVDGNSDVQRCKLIGSTEGILPIASNVEKPKAEVNQLLIQPDVKSQSEQKVDPIYPEQTNQISTRSSGSSSAFVAGINLGSVKTTVNGGGNNASVSSDLAIGFQLGVLYDSNNSQSIGFRTGYMLSFEQMKYNSSPSVWLAFARIPLIAQYLASEKITLNGGLNFDIWLFEMSDGDFVFKDESMSRWFNPSLSLGAEYKLQNRLSIFANYNIGLNNMITSDYSKYDDVSIKMKKTIIEAGLKFGL